jgi:hypothetical protein
MSRIRNLKGQTFGKLTVVEKDNDRIYENKIKKGNSKVYWLCQCSCGNPVLISVESSKLTTNNTKSCGCYKSDRAKDRMIDLAGKLFGNLKVIKVDEAKTEKYKDTYWICECQCEDKNILSTRTSDLTKGKTKSCGCLKSSIIKNRFRNLINIGDIFGKLTVVSYDEERSRCTGKKHKNNYWICECECGELTSVMTTNLIQGNTLSCGCLNSKNELIIKNILNKYNINYIPQMKYDGLLGVGGRKLSYDFYLPNYNALIEYQGEFHDGNIRYYNVDKNELKERLIIQQEHDKRKKDYADNNNINLIEIWYYDHKNDNGLENLLLNKIETIKGEL